jgi:Zn-dependent peptidase ImmA (M78 family)/DNA-binding XRE family transcriptional regulator
VRGETFNADRLILARRRRGMSKTDLAHSVTLTTRSLYDFETGRAEPGAETLDAIADALKFPREFFFRPSIAAPSVGAASFRSLKSMTAGQRDAALSAGALAFELAQWIDARFELPGTDVPSVRDQDPEAAAMMIRARWGIGERPIGNLIHLLESKGVRVFSLAEQGKSLDAFSLWHRDFPFVFLNTNKTAEHSRMDAAHELGHLVLHRHGGPQGRDVEKDAQAFASAFLMPTGSVLSLVTRFSAPTMTHLVQLKKNWGVSVAAMNYRLHVLGVLSDWQYRMLCIEIAKYGRSREPEGMARETSQVLAKVMSALRADGTTKADVAKQLGLYTADIDALMFGLGLSPVSEGRPKPDGVADRRRRALRLA